MKTKFTVLLVAIVLISSIPLMVAAQPGGFSSWTSINRTGTADSYMIIDRSGVSTSRFKVDTSSIAVYAPTDLVLTMVGDHEVSITWTLGINACNTMVRAAVGSLPCLNIEIHPQHQPYLLGIHHYQLMVFWI